MDDEISSLQFSPTHGHTPTSPQDAGHYIPIIPHFDNFRLTPSILGPLETDTRMLSSSAPIMSGARDRRFSRNRVDGMDEKAMFKLDVVRVDNGEDIRTTCMIRNIPNKYTQKMLLAKVDEGHKGTYDFFYLPIDFKNKCNVGYAFINFINPRSISEFYRDFNNKRWEKFNSEKICEITYARIQGKVIVWTIRKAYWCTAPLPMFGDELIVNWVFWGVFWGGFWFFTGHKLRLTSHGIVLDDWLTMEDGG
eukprot:TRINITY_DN1795_c0_g2_i9.p1 TRINITY_DN1795_c0_g2~~TRINITY_DN1795_c0_g2_i9.p1  ORF type:complete len:271 (-),score=34.98 TRINITY_DN1795_c0_g2_i9:56-805(-)